VDARVAAIGQDATPGPFGKAWRDKLSRGCNPVRVVSIGDSVVWGQGLEHDQKFPRLTAELLGAATGRGSQNLDYSISGAVLDAPELPAGNDDGACLGEQYAQDPDRDGEMEFGEVTQQMPDVFCQLERAKANAEAGGYPVDLVVLNGCINDVDPFFGVGVGITPGSEDLPRAIRRECSGIGAAAENPAKNVPYFSGAKVGYGGRGMQAAIEKAHSLPGNPKVLVADFNYAFSRASIPVMRQYCNTDGLTAEQASRCRQGLGAAADRYEQFTRYSAEAYRQAAQAANAKSPDGPYAVAADGLFTLDNAVLAPEQLVWADPTKDSVYSLRRFACPELSSTPSQCITAAIAHPDVPGARHYAESFLLNPRVRAWFDLPSADGHQAFTTSQSTGPVGLEVTFDASAAAGRRTGSERYQWYFGDGTRLVTDAPTASHAYRGAGPHLPRLVVTDSGGGRTLYEAPEPIVITAPVSASGG
jgi:hypothetical protein